MQDRPDQDSPQNTPADQPQAASPPGTPGSAPGSAPGSPGPVRPVGGSAPPPPPGYAPAYAPPPPPAKQSRGVMSRIAAGLLSTVLLASIGLNIYLGIFFVQMTSGVRESVYQQGDASQRIVIVPVSGMIDGDVAGYMQDVFTALDNDPPKAVILRVDSGGGSVAASDRIWHYVTQFQKKHPEVPIVSSFGGIAASGGYYIAAPSDYILAEPSCITGSIGVMAQAFTVNGLLEKIGITPEVLVATDSPEKDLANDIFNAWTDEDRQKLRSFLDHFHDRFIEVVAQGRADVLNPDEVKSVSDGRTLTAAGAVREKLIDEVGFLSDAIEKTKSLASIDPSVIPQVTMVKRPQSFGLGILQHRGVSVDDLDARHVRRLLTELSTPRLEYRWTP